MNTFSPFGITKLLQFRNIKKISYLNHVKTGHIYHLVDPSPWPLTIALGVTMIVIGIALRFNGFRGGLDALIMGAAATGSVVYGWWRDVIREGTFESQHSAAVQKGLRLGVALFIASEVMFFFAFFWAFFHSSVAPVYNIGAVWPPKAVSIINTYTVPLSNTFILLTSGMTVTAAHHAVLGRMKRYSLILLGFTILLAYFFMSAQKLEYRHVPFFISDGVYGACFFMTTGFHGFHVFVGTIALITSFIRISFNHFTYKHHVGFESAIWYWHFVDVVWLFLFLGVYWWGNK